MKAPLGLVTGGFIVVIVLSGCGLSPPSTEAGRTLRDLCREIEVPDAPERALDKLAAIGCDAVEPVVAFHKKYRRSFWSRRRKAAGLAVEFLARIADRDAFPKLIELARERDRLISLCSVYGIRSMATQGDTNDIIALADDARFAWKDRLIPVLGRIGGKEATDALLKYLEDPRERVRRGAYLGLAVLGDVSVIKDLWQAFDNEKDPRFRIAAAEALAVLGDDRGSAHLSSVLMGESPDYLLVAAAYASGRAKQSESVPGLAKLLKHPDSYFREVAREALATIGTEEARKAITSHLPEDQRDAPLPSDYYYFYTYDRDKLMDWDWSYND